MSSIARNCTNGIFVSLLFLAITPLYFYTSKVSCIESPTSLSRSNLKPRIIKTIKSNQLNEFNGSNARVSNDKGEEESSNDKGAEEFSNDKSAEEFSNDKSAEEFSNDKSAEEFSNDKSAEELNSDKELTQNLIKEKSDSGEDTVEGICKEAESSKKIKKTLIGILLWFINLFPFNLFNKIFSHQKATPSKITENNDTSIDTSNNEGYDEVDKSE